MHHFVRDAHHFKEVLIIFLRNTDHLCDRCSLSLQEMFNIFLRNAITSFLSEKPTQHLCETHTHFVTNAHTPPLPSLWEMPTHHLDHLCNLSSVKSSDQYMILVMHICFMWCLLEQPFALFLKIEHFSKQSEHFYVVTRLNLGDGTLKTLKDLAQVIGFKASSHVTIRRWPALFCFKDKGKETAIPLIQPKTISNDEKASAVAESMKADPYICIQKTSSKLALLLEIVHKILHGNLWESSLQGGYCKNWHVQRACWVDNATYLFSLFEPSGPKRLTNMVTSNETWMHVFMELPANFGKLLSSALKIKDIRATSWVFKARRDYSGDFSVKKGLLQ